MTHLRDSTVQSEIVGWLADIEGRIVVLEPEQIGCGATYSVNKIVVHAPFGCHGFKHIIRIKTEETPKVVASVWRKEFIQRIWLIHPFLSQIILVQFILVFKIVLGKTVSAARNWINAFPPNRSDDLRLVFRLYPSSIGLRLNHVLSYLYKLCESPLYQNAFKHPSKLVAVYQYILYIYASRFIPSFILLL